jgi:hypothetical protein
MHAGSGHVNICYCSVNTVRCQPWHMDTFVREIHEMRVIHEETQLIMQSMRTRGESMEKKIECALERSSMAYRSAKELEQDMIRMEYNMGWMSAVMGRFGMPHFQPPAVLTAPGVVIPELQ